MDHTENELTRLRRLPKFRVIHSTTGEIRWGVEENDDYFLSVNEEFPNRLYPFVGRLQPPVWKLRKPHWVRSS